MRNKLIYLVALILLVVPLYPKFPLVGVSGTFVAVRLEDILIAVVVAIWGIANIKSWRQITGEPINRAILLYWAAGAVATFGAIFVTKTADMQQGVLHLLRRVEYMSLFVVASSVLQTKEQLAWLAKVLVMVAAIVACYGVGQLLLNFPVISTNNSEFSKGLALTLGPGARINSTFAGHYDLAAYSLFPILLLVGLLTLPGKNKLALIGVGALTYWAMLLSASRATFAAVIITVSLFLWQLRKKTWLAVWIIIVAASVWLSPQLVGRYKELIVNQLLTTVSPVSAQVDTEVADALKPPAQPEDRSFNIRLKVEWPRALRAIVKNPVIGTGFSSVGLAVDNDYLRSLAETGILGTAALVLVFIRVFQSLLAKSKASGLPQIFAQAVMWGVVGLLINAVFIDVFEASKVAIMTWTLLGLAIRAKSLA